MRKTPIIEYDYENSFVCIRFSRILLALSIILTLLLQGMTFFVAVNAGYEEMNSLIYAAVPYIGPLICCFQLILSGIGSPLIILALLIPCFLTMVGWAYLRDEYTRILYSESISEAEIQSKKYGFTTPQPKPSPIPEFQPKPKPMPIPVPKPETLPQPQPIKKPVIQPPPAQQETELHEAHAYNVKPNETNEAAAAKKTVDEEYNKALQDVLAILNKR
ncbi:MAG: hypothetical protein PHH84_04845 [Oscillospiraceae bacterium]|nr:hypothetical protein [Oscillospiraceae bacterium]MDD4413625.1 hypothetical protein [Oscillospiraceae bacterium]